MMLSWCLSFYVSPRALFRNSTLSHEITHMCQSWKPGISICHILNISAPWKTDLISTFNRAYVHHPNKYLVTIWIKWPLRTPQNQTDPLIRGACFTRKHFSFDNGMRLGRCVLNGNQYMTSIPIKLSKSIHPYCRQKEHFWEDLLADRLENMAI